ncbi:hypothetical protein OV450_8436 [Actinobacteria bacterium OV450]|nr:hypothetical protein OV450_8436 [Actinobacteria bacterium OV450]
MIGLAQLYRRDAPYLLAGPEDCSLLQVFWCLFGAHGEIRTGMRLALRWVRFGGGRQGDGAAARGGGRGLEGCIPQPCVLAPEQVVTSLWLLLEELCARIGPGRGLEEDAVETGAGGRDWPTHHFDPSIPSRLARRGLRVLHP